jgi:2-oxoglutarate dehydrogenase E2 component (dihydrolipoamide succinyltransferase)
VSSTPIDSIKPISLGSDSSSGVSPGARKEHRVKMNRMRLRIAQRLKDAQNTYAMLTTFNEIDMRSLFISISICFVIQILSNIELH